MLLYLAFLMTLACYAATPIPKVTPIPITPDSYPFGAADHTRVSEDLSKSCSTVSEM